MVGDDYAPHQAMRIAYVGNFIPRHSTENHVAESLRLNGYEVLPFQEDAQYKVGPNGVEVDRVSSLAERVLEAGCELLIYTKTWGLPGSAIDQWRFLDANGCPTISYHLDLYFGLDREAQLDYEPFWRTQLVFSADGGHQEEFAARGIDHEWMKPGVFGPECVSGTPDSKWSRFDVAFVGSHSWYHPEWAYRMELVKFLRSTWRNKCALLPRYGQPAIRNEDLNDLYASIPVFVGDSTCLGFTGRNYWSDRIYETLGRGGFLIHPYIDGIEDEFQDGEHCVFYKFGDWTSLRQLVDHYIGHPEQARAIAARGQAHVRANYTYQHRTTDMLERLVARGLLTRYQVPYLGLVP